MQTQRTSVNLVRCDGAGLCECRLQMIVADLLES